MLKGTYKFLDYTKVSCFFDPKKSSETQVYIKWSTDSGEYRGYLPREGLKLKRVK
jgi:hypothetical protein